MSILCTTYVPEGMVIAADSRASVNMNLINKDDPSKQLTHIFPATDSMQKVYLLKKVQVGISVMCGALFIENMSVSNFIADFERTMVKFSDSVYDIANKLFAIAKKYPKLLTFHIVGFDGAEPFFYVVSSDSCKRLNMQNTAIQYGITWTGEVATVQKIMMSEPKIALDFKSFPIYDAIELTDFLINTAITAQRFEMKPKTCGGPVDILVLTKDGAFWHKHKFYNNSFIPMPESQRTGCYVSYEDGKPIN